MWPHSRATSLIHCTRGVAVRSVVRTARARIFLCNCCATAHAIPADRRGGYSLWHALRNSPGSSTPMAWDLLRSRPDRTFVGLAEEIAASSLSTWLSPLRISTARSHVARCPGGSWRTLTRRFSTQRGGAPSKGCPGVPQGVSNLIKAPTEVMFIRPNFCRLCPWIRMAKISFK